MVVRIMVWLGVRLMECAESLFARALDISHEDVVDALEAFTEGE